MLRRTVRGAMSAARAVLRNVYLNVPPTPIAISSVALYVMGQLLAEPPVATDVIIWRRDDDKIYDDKIYLHRTATTATGVFTLRARLFNERAEVIPVDEQAADALVVIADAFSDPRDVSAFFTTYYRATLSLMQTEQAERDHYRREANRYLVAMGLDPEF